MTIEEVLAYVRREPGPHLADGVLAVWHSSGAPSSSSGLDVVGEAHPSADLLLLWQQSSLLRLFEDVKDRQWGLEILPPEVALELTRSLPGFLWRDSDTAEGDLVVGRLIGSEMHVIVRCDPTQPDYGTVLVTLEIDLRDDWPVVGGSLSEFLTRFIEAGGSHYWPH